MRSYVGEVAAVFGKSLSTTIFPTHIHDLTNCIGVAQMNCSYLLFFFIANMDNPSAIIVQLKQMCVCVCVDMVFLFSVLSIHLCNYTLAVCAKARQCDSERAIYCLLLRMCQAKIGKLIHDSTTWRRCQPKNAYIHTAQAITHAKEKCFDMSNPHAYNLNLPNTFWRFHSYYYHAFHTQLCTYQRIPIHSHVHTHTVQRQRQSEMK